MSSQVLVPCVKGACCRPSTSTEFSNAHPAELQGIISADEFQSSISRINASLQRPKWTFRVQTIGRMLMLVGLLILIVSGGKYLHYKMKHHGGDKDKDENKNDNNKENENKQEYRDPFCPYPPCTIPDGAMALAQEEFTVTVPVPMLEPTVQTLPLPVPQTLPPPHFPEVQTSVAEDPNSKRDADNDDDDDSDDDKDEDKDENKDEDKEHGERRRHHWKRGKAGHHGRRRHHGHRGEKNEKKDADQKVGDQKHSGKHGRCIKHMLKIGFGIFLAGLGLCRWMVAKKKHLLITRVVPAVCAEHHYYTSSGRAVPVSWSLEEQSVKFYNCKNNALKLVLDLHTVVPLARMNEKELNMAAQNETMSSSASSYLPLNTNEQA